MAIVEAIVIAEVDFRYSALNVVEVGIDTGSLQLVVQVTEIEFDDLLANCHSSAFDDNPEKDP